VLAQPSEKKAKGLERRSVPDSAAEDLPRFLLHGAEHRRWRKIAEPLLRKGWRSA